jgi:hypothetical protein
MINEFPRTLWALFSVGLIITFISLPHVYNVDKTTCLMVVGGAYGILLRNLFK